MSIINIPLGWQFILDRHFQAEACLMMFNKSEISLTVVPTNPLQRNFPQLQGSF